MPNRSEAAQTDYLPVSKPISPLTSDLPTSLPIVLAIVLIGLLLERRVVVVRVVVVRLGWV